RPSSKAARTASTGRASRRCATLPTRHSATSSESSDTKEALMAAIPPVCDFGWKAVDARLPAVDGKTWSIFDLKGPNGLVVAFICNHCPYVKAVISRIVRDAEDLRAHGIGFVAISSNDAASYPEDSFDNMRLFAKKH